MCRAQSPSSSANAVPSKSTGPAPGLSKENIELLEAKKLSYIVGARLKRLDRTLAGKVQEHGLEASIRSSPVDDKSRLVARPWEQRKRRELTGYARLTLLLVSWLL